jgi:CheY-like chemotaxis protein
MLDPKGGASLPFVAKTDTGVLHLDGLASAPVELKLEATGVVGDRALVERVVLGLVALVRPAEDARVEVSTRDHQRAGARSEAPEPWVEVLIRAPGSADAPACARVAAPLLAGDGVRPVLDVSRTPGKGTTLRLLLPVVESPAEPAGPIVLLADDDIVIRETLAEALRAKGYRVIAAANGQAALESLDLLPGPIDVLLTDLMMPRMSGIELARRLLARQPGLKLLFMSAMPLVRGASLPGPLIPKPLDLNVLVDQVPPLVASLLSAGPPAGA